ncbi:zinc finger protein PLAGL2-like isoform X1 [Anguilla anguilla]|uniref:zinc finger protein PLAGL2-like isoform X1 n=2 Tax=Anguilla anguilla TaxID=7936 RepID=UPI0015B0391E|nr:zinc finger protein PLAGL2-like isoform X1 [Anguilla anguilla]XP_035242861.1 zinc finger protein PLAGL2-like isoform X1 [Anguilla anguilla]
MTAVVNSVPCQCTTVIPESNQQGAVARQCQLVGAVERGLEREREGDWEREIERNWDGEKGIDRDLERERISSECEGCGSLCSLSSGQDKLRLPACRPLLCSHPFCEKAFTSKYKLLRHMATHSLQKTHQCSVCAKMFHRKDHLKNHLQTHDPNKEAFRCGECGKSYSTKLGYKRHAAMHAAANGDLTCKVCLLRLETTPALLEHLRGHSGGVAGGVKEKKHPCAHCERRFYTRKDVRRHMVVHTGRKDFLCQFCTQRFGRKDHLTRHAKKSHSQELLKGGAESQGVDPGGALGLAIKEELSPVMCSYSPMGLYGPHLQATPTSGGAYHPLMAGSLGMGCHMEPSNPLHHSHPHLHPRHPHHLHPTHSPPPRPPPQTLPGSTSYLKLEMESFLMDLQSGLPAPPLAEAPGSAPTSDLPHSLQAESPAPIAESLCMANMDVTHLLSFLPLSLPPYSAPLSAGGPTAGYSTSSNSSSASSSSSSTSHGTEPLSTPLTSLRTRPQEPSGHAFSSHTLPRFHQAFQ